MKTNWGALLFSTGRFEDARAELEKAAALGPSYAPAQNNLGAVYERTGKLLQAAAAYRKAVAAWISITPRHGSGRVLLTLGSFREAETDLRRAPPTPARRARIFSGRCRRRTWVT